MGYYLGIDIGSISVKLAVIDEDKNILWEIYKRIKERPLETFLKAIDELPPEFSLDKMTGGGVTGTGGRILSELLGIPFVNEIVSHTKAVEHLHPEVKTIIDMGGEDSKLILVERDAEGRFEILDFSLNSLCAAGTGSFLDQQATRLGYTIEEFGKVALKSKNPPRIAGRCSVFAKSDMIHLQQIGTPDYDIIAGLCFSLARNFKSTIGKGRAFRKPVSFQGGVAANLGMRRAFREILGLSEDELIIPDHFATMGAIGAAIFSLENHVRVDLSDLSPVKEYITKTSAERDAHEPLSLDKTRIIESVVLRPKGKERIPAYLGIDVGSISTNLVVIDEDGNVLAKRYLMTAGRPLEAIKKGLGEIGEEIGDRVEIVGVGTTGSGRYLAGDFVGADVIRNEITAQARAAVHIDPKVDTIFEIGGQDSKYIAIDDGAVVDFEMNKACAAGTGSFLEEQAERLGINIKGEFQELALKSKSPVRMGERCTVFMESDLVHHLQQGAPVEDICAGLAYSIVYNYLNRVVGDKRIGKNIFFQGGTAFNKAVVAAFEKVLGRGITVPPHHEVTGAIGAALLAKEEKPEGKTRFKGFDLSNRKYTLETFECNGCSNVCMISKVTIEGEKPLFYGGRCEKWEVDRRRKSTNIPDYFDERKKMLMEYYERALEKTKDADEEIGIPFAMFFHEFLPLWSTFFSELGIKPVLSDETNKTIIKNGVEAVVSELCFPVKIAHGHVLNLIKKGVKRIFIPSFIDQPSLVEKAKRSFNCPFSQTLPYTIRSAINPRDYGVEFLTPIIRMGRGESIEIKDFVELGKLLGRSSREAKKAWKKAKEAQDEFFRRQKELGRRVLSELSEDKVCMVVVGRPYNIYDLSANLDIPKKLRHLNVHVIPIDFLPIDEEKEIDDELKEMYWKYGQKILKAASIIRKDPRLYPVYITNFGCGPDSFITHFFKRTLGGKPFLQLEIDEHSADAGLITRCEAFLDSLKNNKNRVGKREPFVRPPIKPGQMKKIYIPYMCDHSFAFAATFRACGINAEVFPESDEQTLILGRRYCSGKECYPCILTTGDMVKIAISKNFDPKTTAFFMPSGNGPCRFGQYNRFHRMVLDEIGFPETPIFAPNQDDTFYETLEMIGSKFLRLGWWSIVAVDILTKLLHENRPYEREKGSVERAYRKYLNKVCEVIEKEEGIDVLSDVLKKAAQEITSLKDPKAPQKPIVGVVGEIYVRSNRFANEDIIRKIEAYGGEAWLAPISEWIHYINAMAKRKAREERNWKALMGLKLKEYYQDKDQEKLEKAVEGYVKNLPEPSTDYILKLASPYIDPSFEGEAILTIGKAIDFHMKGACGIVSCMPFSCMPGTVTTAIFKRLREDRDNVPVLDLAFDGQKELNTLIRLEAFMFQVKEYFRRRGGLVMEVAN